MLNKQNFSYSKIIKFIIITILILSCALILGFFAIYKIITYGVFENKISDYTGLKIEFKNPKASFDYKLNFKVSADSIDIYSKNKTSHFVDIKDFDFSFKPINLIFKKISINNLKAKNLIINIKRDSLGRFDFFDVTKKDKLYFNEFNLSSLISKIDNIELNYQDEYKIKSLTKLKINNSTINISLKNQLFKIIQQGSIETKIADLEPSTSVFDINIISKYPFNNIKSQDLNLNIYLDDINLYILSDFAKKYISKDISRISGKIDLSVLTKEDNSQNLILNVNSPSIYLNTAKLIKPYDKILVKSQFSADKNKISILNYEISSNELNVKGDGEISKLFSKISKYPQIEINSNINNTQINNIIPFLPDNLIVYKPDGIPTLKNSNFFGVVSGNTKLKLFPLDMTGNLKISNVHIPNYPKSYVENDVNLTFMKDKMRVYTKVYTPQGEYVVIDGISNLDDSLYGKYSVKSSRNVDLSFAQLYLTPISQIIGFNIGPVPIMKITGTGNIDIKTQGTVKDAQIFGQFSANNASAIIEGIDAKLIHGDCRLIFDNRNLIFKEIKGKMEGATFLLTGLGNTKGEVDLDIKLDNALTSTVLKIFRTSEFTKPYANLAKDISAVSGIINTKINLKGTITNYETPEFLNNLTPSGKIELKNNKVILNNGFKINNLIGLFDFGSKQSGFFEFLINDSKFNLEFSIKDSLDKVIKNETLTGDFAIASNKINSKDILYNFKNSAVYKNLNKRNKDIISLFDDINFYSKLNVRGDIILSLKNLNDVKLKNLKGFLIGLNSSKNKNIKFNSGLIKFNDNKLIFDNFNTSISGGKIKIKGDVQDFITKNPNYNLNVNLENIKLDKLGSISKTKLTNATLKSAEINASKDTIRLNSFNVDYNSMPIFLNAKINLAKNNNFVISTNFATILNENTIDTIVNPYLNYPIKIKGEIPIKGEFFGDSQNYSVNFSATLPENSDISYSGANLGDIELKREIAGRINVQDKIATLNNLRLIKFIKNQSNRQNPITTISLFGQAIQKNNSIFYNNFRIITSQPINVRILNLIFKKSLLKKGNFECDITLNGDIKQPKIIGNFNLQDLDIPVYDTQINNIKISLTQNFIDAHIIAKNKQNDVKAFFRATNKLTPPYIINKLYVDSNKINIKEIIESIPENSSKSDIVAKNDLTIKPEDIIIKDGNIHFRDVSFNKINLQNLKGNFSYNNNSIDLKKIIFNIAQGTISANGQYNLKTTKLNLKADMQDCDANNLAQSFLNLNNQIFGKMQGNINLSAKNLDTPKGIENVESSVNFSINNGKMPKLGSLEYLLRAGNLIKNGLLGLSLNNLIQILTPYKTGEFEKISGSFDLKKAKVENLEIQSKGKNLSLYSTGEYNILNTTADIKIYGKLSQKISNALGAVGNASIKQVIGTLTNKEKKEKDIELQKMLDKIPPIDIEDESRYFRVQVFGDINKENYIKKFEWK